MVVVAIGVVVAALTLFRPAETPASAQLLREWPQFNLNAQHSGSTNTDTAIRAGNVARLQKFFEVELPGVADGAPVYLAGVTTPSGVRDLLFATTRPGDLLALDAASGATVWVKHNPAPSCQINPKGDPCFTTSSPALDPNRQFVYSYGLEGSVHKYRVGDGTEITGGGWPALTSLKIDQEKGSSALTLVTARNGQSYLYATHAYYPAGTRRNQGHLTAINLQDGSQHVFNAACSDQFDQHFKPGGPDCSVLENGIWARGPVVYLPETDKIYLTTGCCTFDPAQHQWGQTTLALRPDGTGNRGDPLDSYTPVNWRDLNANIQLASTAPAILPTPANSSIRRLGAQAGKDGKLRLLNLDNLSGQNSLGNLGGELSQLDLPQKSPVFTALAVWVNPADSATWVFVASITHLSAYRLEIDPTGQPRLNEVWQKAQNGNSPLVINNLLYYLRPNEIGVLDPLTGKTLWRDSGVGPVHWQSPIVAAGVLYATDENSRLVAFAVDRKRP